ncbi:site-2 protease family protein [Arenibacter sp. TNZ]|jgi:Zn-dependent protease|uniref:site-2 protease family protein n=1 Tax=Arenibacter TaxID=178469 RepID=UPI000CD3D0A0|nr:MULTISPECIES: site-2 protease family protein [Arenibacter]MCM4173307.1 site-2 protease family protein [Arenibacter sp. TNZ]
MKGFLKLGKVAGIQLEVHWTFALLLIWAGFVEFQNSGNFERVAINQGFILVLMACVVLHELGHALTARKFNIKTKRIILLPIGGVATLDKMPEKPEQELLVALAGPAVNVVIAIILSLIIPLKSYFNFDNVVVEEMLYEPNLQNFLFYLFIANVMLVVFNLIPAFPMDGGRVLRALLAFRLSRVQATNIAAGIGQTLAVVFFILGFFVNPFLILIAFFIFFGAYGENQMVKRNSLLQGHLVKEATLTKITVLRPDNNVQEVIDILLAGTEKDFVVALDKEILGIVTQNDVIKYAKNPSILVKDIMDKNFTIIDESTEITKVLELVGKERKHFFPVTGNKKLIGAIDMVNISEFILLKSVS